MVTKIKLCDAVRIDVHCERNNEEDISFGGPIMLGYTFYVSKNEDISDIKNFIRECIKKYNRPFITMQLSIKSNLNVRYLNTKEQIEESIRMISI